MRAHREWRRRTQSQSRCRATPPALCAQTRARTAKRNTHAASSETKAARTSTQAANDPAKNEQCSTAASESQRPVRPTYLRELDVEVQLARPIETARTAGFVSQEACLAVSNTLAPSQRKATCIQHETPQALSDAPLTAAAASMTQCGRPETETDEEMVWKQNTTAANPTNKPSDDGRGQKRDVECKANGPHAARAPDDVQVEVRAALLEQLLRARPHRHHVVGFKRGGRRRLHRQHTPHAQHDQRSASCA